MQTPTARADDEPHNVPQARQVDELVGHGRKLRVQLQTEKALPAHTAERVTEQDRRVAHEAAQLDDGLGLDLFDEVRDEFALGGTDVHQVALVLGEVVNGGEDLLRVAFEFGEVGEGVDVVEQLEVTVTLVLQ